MIRMTKKVNGKLLFWEVWQEFNKDITIQHGTVGAIGEVESRRVKLFQKAEKVMEGLAQEKEQAGFQYLPEDELFQVVVQCKFDGSKNREEILEMKDEMEYILNEALGSTGNGACYEGSIENGRMSIMNYVVDVEIAGRTIKEAFMKNDQFTGEWTTFYFNTEEGQEVLLDKGRKA
ncbi:hypothetical protein FZC84_01470 [Rossellomorea vietnamensis]|uniref:WGR domain-containing protein n=1 Tax=Rossellomorea vietnamensis TaxID=218284 RepID=A0A5D4MK42_9BACI|nr:MULTISPECIES: hypothetical protein [Bacillaceae]TYS01356.1 hypothetical protein FZC84_01470 [Rossellomorea vietnamensis]